MRDGHVLVPRVGEQHDAGKDRALICTVVQVDLGRVHTTSLVEDSGRCRQARGGTVHKESHRQPRPERRCKDGQVLRVEPDRLQVAPEAQCRPSGACQQLHRVPKVQVHAGHDRSGLTCCKVVKRPQRQPAQATQLLLAVMHQRTAHLLRDRRIKGDGVLLLREVPAAVQGCTFQDGAGEQAAALWAQQVELHGEGTRGVAQQSHPLRIPAEGRQVAAQPAQGQALVQGLVVAKAAVLRLLCQGRVRPMSEEADAEGEDDEDHVIAQGETCGVVPAALEVVGIHEAAAKEVDDDWPRVAWRHPGGHVHVQEKAILAGADVLAQGWQAGAQERALLVVVDRVPHALPTSPGPWCPEALRLLSIGHAPEGAHALHGLPAVCPTHGDGPHEATQGAPRGLHDGWIRLVPALAGRGRAQQTA
mmetsp:Transcript_29868/g.95218  ORF Transcript_29868/g.95218 Transcript_29868/m.95218 type:complete len:418 (+) Transcript_29868:853-2106(+)